MCPQDMITSSEPNSLHQVAPIMNASNDDHEYESEGYGYEYDDSDEDEEDEDEEDEEEPDEETINMARNMGISVKEMLELFKEWNNLDDAFIYNNPHHDCPPEWPDFTGSGGGYEDEGAEESGHGISYGFDSNTPLHMPPRIVIAESAIEEDV